MRTSGQPAFCSWRSNNGPKSLSLAATAGEDAVSAHTPSTHLPGCTALASSAGSVVWSMAHICLDVSACSLSETRICVRCIHSGSAAMLGPVGAGVTDLRGLRSGGALVDMVAISLHCPAMPDSIVVWER